MFTVNRFKSRGSFNQDYILIKLIIGKSRRVGVSAANGYLPPLKGENLEYFTYLHIFCLVEKYAFHEATAFLALGR